MDKNQLDGLKAKHPALFELCTKSPYGERPLSKDRVEAMKTEKDFIMACLTNEPRLDFYLKLLGLQQDFDGFVQVPTTGLTDKLLAQEYIDKHFNWTKSRASEVDPGQLRDTVKAKVLECAAHFSGKLINSEAGDTFAVCTGGYQSQPHVSSRTIIASGYGVPLDQTKLDNTGFYQRILMVLEKNPVSQVAELDATLVAAVEAGAKAAFDNYGEKRIPSVDRRLRQILLPSGDQYLAVSPLASGGICVLFDRAISQIEQVTTEEPETEAAKEEDDSKKTATSRHLYTRLGFPIGGAIVRNVSIHSKGAVQRPVFFEVPVRHPDLRSVWTFVYRPLRLSIPRDLVEKYRQYTEGLPESIRGSSATTATVVERAGPLREIVFRQHQQLLDLSNNLQEIPFVEEGVAREIDADLLVEKRADPPAPMDLAVVNGSFDRDYAKAMAEAIALKLYAAVHTGTKKQPLHQVDRDRIRFAAQEILGGLL